jgi:hypothetical protein
MWPRRAADVVPSFRDAPPDYGAVTAVLLLGL